MYDYQITIAPGWLPDGRQGWNLLAAFRYGPDCETPELRGQVAARRCWGTYATFERLERNLPRFEELAAAGPTWDELDYENGGMLAEVVAVARYAPGTYREIAGLPS